MISIEEYSLLQQRVAALEEIVNLLMQPKKPEIKRPRLEATEVSLIMGMHAMKIEGAEISRLTGRATSTVSEIKHGKLKGFEDVKQASVQDTLAYYSLLANAPE